MAQTHKSKNVTDTKLSFPACASDRNIKNSTILRDFKSTFPYYASHKGSLDTKSLDHLTSLVHLSGCVGHCQSPPTPDFPLSQKPFGKKVFGLFAAAPQMRTEEKKNVLSFPEFIWTGDLGGKFNIFYKIVLIQNLIQRLKHMNTFYEFWGSNGNRQMPCLEWHPREENVGREGKKLI